LNVLRRFVPETVVGGIMGLRTLANMMGGVFDVEEEKS